MRRLLCIAALIGGMVSGEAHATGLRLAASIRQELSTEVMPVTVNIRPCFKVDPATGAMRAEFCASSGAASSSLEGQPSSVHVPLQKQERREPAAR